MGLESFGKILGSLASTTAKKAGEQVQITKLAIDKAGLEKQIEGIYCAMGRYCHTMVKKGESIPEQELLEYCRDVETLQEQIASLDEEIVQHREVRNATEYHLPRNEGDVETTAYAEAAQPASTPAAEGAAEPEPETQTDCAAAAYTETGTDAGS